MISALPPLPVALPLAVAAAILPLGKFLPRRLPDVIALLVALAVGVLDWTLLVQAKGHPPDPYWFGNWRPRHGAVLGIAFVVGQADAAIGILIAVLSAATFVFAWGYFEDIRSFFHVLMLLFLAGMQGFCLTHDLFNLFVWFEVMSVTAFALTAYRLESASLQGALNFTVTNTIGSYLLLTGIGLLYLRLGTLDFGALGTGLAKAPDDPIAMGAFCALATALLIKGAMVPFQFWLADAHAVAPSPVSAIFSGAMVPLGIFGLMKLEWEVFGGVPAVHTLTRTLLLYLGTASAMLGGFACLRQRHLKRLLAFSTISHVGVMLCAVALLTPRGVAAFFAYIVGHGLVKAALFMIMGILLASARGIDEIWLLGRGRDLMPAGVVMIAGGLLLGGAPIGLLDEGAKLLDEAANDQGKGWILAALMLGTACTGGAVLRASGRVFFGLGAGSGGEERGPTEAELEPADRPFWLMLLPPSILLVLSVVLVPAGGEMAALIGAARFVAWDRGATVGSLLPVQPIPPTEPPHPFMPWLALGLSLMIAIHDLARSKLPRIWLAVSDAALRPLFVLVDRLHNGLIGDYVTWILVGLAMLSLGFLAIAS